MTIEEWLGKSSGLLKDCGVKTARLDSLVLLEDALKQNRASILAHPEQRIPAKTEVTLNNKITQRSQHIPLAYIRGKIDFYRRHFAVNRSVLTPRPETETIIELAKKLDPPPGSSFLDVGTGSGAIAITVKLEMPDFDVYATDTSEKALQVARRNATSLGAKVRFEKTDLIPSTPKERRYWLIAANLPYVPDGYKINKAAQFEPKAALFAGKDGLDLYQRFWAQIEALTHPPKHIITESLPFQHAANTKLAHVANFSPVKASDLVQLFLLKA